MKQGFAQLALIALTIILITSGLAVFFLTKNKTPQNPTSEPIIKSQTKESQTNSATNGGNIDADKQTAESNLKKPTTLKKTKEDDSFVYYNGSIIISGTYKVQHPGTQLGGYLCFTADNETGYLVPRELISVGGGIYEDPRGPRFCFDDQNKAKKTFDINDELIFKDKPIRCSIEGKAIIKVSNYVVFKLDSDAFVDTATLDKIISKDNYTIKCK